MPHLESLSHDELLASHRRLEARLQLLHEVALDEFGFEAVALTQQGVIMATNAAMPQMLGYDRDELLGRRVDTLVAPEALDQVARAMAAGSSVPYETTVQRKDGTRLDVEVFGRPASFGDRSGRVAVLRDITWRKATERELRKSEARYRELFEGASDLIHSLRPDGRFAYVNPAWLTALGYDMHEVSKLHFLDVLHPDDHALGRALFASVMAGHVVRDAQVRILTRAGATLHLDGAISPRRDEDGEIVGTRAIFRDVSARRDAERTRDEFLAMITHDLRTPLTSLHGALGLLVRGYVEPGTPEAAEILGVAYESTQRLVRLADDFLDVGRLDAGAMTFRPQRVGARALLDRARAELAAMAERAEVAVSVADAPPELLVDTDPDRVVQVLVNLLSNAVKFSDAGSVVAIAARRDGREIVFSVADRGRGIPEAMREAVFERYGQVLPGDATELGGSGLGLAICKRLVGALGGRLWLESAVGAGSTFSFSLPAPIEKASPLGGSGGSH